MARKVTDTAIAHFLSSRKLTSGNTTVEVLPNVTILKLHGNAIAYRYNDPERTLSISNCGWFTPTTKERLNAIPGVSIVQKKGVWYLNGKEWNGHLIDVNPSSAVLNNPVI